MSGDKTQMVRLIDVLFLGPFMVWYGSTLKCASILARSFMISITCKIT